MIKEYIKNYTKAGKNYRALCPFHREKEPSFHFTDNDLWYCFGCGLGGNGSKFAELVGIPYNYSSNNKEIEINIRTRLSDSYVKGYQKNLWNNINVFTYLITSRGLKPFVIKEYKLGYDYETKRYTIPIYDYSNKLVAIKMHNSFLAPKAIFHNNSGKVKLPYPVNMLRYKNIIICEGEFDCLLLISLGFKAISSTSGCTYFPDEWIKLLQNKNVVIAYDNDESGLKNGVIVAEKLSNVSNVKIFNIPKEYGKDITDCYHSNLKFLINTLSELIKK